MKLLKPFAKFVLLLPLTAHATNGYFAHGYGVRSKSMAGVGVASAQDAIAAAINPAGMVFVDDRIDVELEAFSPHRQYSVQGAPTLAAGAFPLQNGTFRSREEFFLIPTVGWNYHIDDTQTVGITLYGNGCMNSDYANVANLLCPPGVVVLFVRVILGLI